MSKLHRSIRNTSDLIRIILNRNSGVSNFALFLGAGASITSGVRGAGAMIEEWRNSAYVASRSTRDLSEWLSDQSWFNDDDEYSQLFELTYDLPPQRRVFIEECVKSAHPGWGYVYLTSLLAHRVFNIVLTTNFDDLINESCYLYSEDLRPMVAAHDSSIAAMRMSSDRPKILKLHGDFLYDNIKNTLRELEALEANTKNKLTQIAQDCGLVVVGYGGRDRSVMDVLDALLRSESYFPHGVYWCVTKGAVKSKRLDGLLRRDRIHLVEVDGFDELMASLQGAAGYELPQPLSAPLKVASERARLFLDVSTELKSHEIISRDMECVLLEMDRAIAAKNLPPLLQAAIAKARGDKEAAIRLWRSELKAHPDDTQIINELASALLELGLKNEAAEIVRAGPDSWSNKTYMLLRAGDCMGVVRVASDRLAKAPLDWVVRMNRAIALKRLGQAEGMAEDVVFLETSTWPEQRVEKLIQLGTAILREERSVFLDRLEQAIAQKLISADDYKQFPIFDDVRGDPEVTFIVERSLAEIVARGRAQSSQEGLPQGRVGPPGEPLDESR